MNNSIFKYLKESKTLTEIQKLSNPGEKYTQYISDREAELELIASRVAEVDSLIEQLKCFRSEIDWEIEALGYRKQFLTTAHYNVGSIVGGMKGTVES